MILSCIVLRVEMLSEIFALRLSLPSTSVAEARATCIGFPTMPLGIQPRIKREAMVPICAFGRYLVRAMAQLYAGRIRVAGRR